MARRPARLSLLHSNTSNHPQTYMPETNSPLGVPPSPTSPLTPIKPPLRLHLRTILPSSPLSPSILQHAPVRPYSWIWRCHLCHSVYRLGVTRRCLEDGHYFCSLRSPVESDAESENEESVADSALSSEVDSIKGERRQRGSPGVGRTRRRRRRRPVRGCRAEFDYERWRNYNRWRSEAALFRASPVADRDSASSSSLSSSSSGSSRPLQNVERTEQENCWTDCNFPSECHNLRLERLKAARAAANMSRRQGRRLSEMIQVELEAQTEMVIDESVEIPPKDNATNHVIDKLNAATSDDAAIMGLESGVPEDDVMDFDGVIDELLEDSVEAEFDFVEKRRKKSIMKIHQLTGLMLGTGADLLSTLNAPAGESQPRSPLKMSFGIDEVEKEAAPVRGVEVEHDTGAVGRDAKPRDYQMEELLRARSDFLRKFDGDEEMFGDEEEE